LRHWTTSRKVAVSIPEGVIGHNPSDRTMVLGLTQPLTEMSKGGRCVGLTSLPPSCTDSLVIWEPQPAVILGQSGPDLATRARLLSFSRTQSRAVIGLFTGHNTLRRHLYVMGLGDNPICRKCGTDEETSAHILCKCEA
jgi:hypothetical protein